MTVIDSPAVPSIVRRPEVGVYRDLPEREYHGWHVCSKHALDTIDEYSPMHLKYERENPREPTAALRIGSALHTLVLSPDLFEAQWPVSTQCAASTGKGAQCKHPGKYFDGSLWYCGTHRGADAIEPADYLTEEQYEQVNRMAEAVYRHPAAKALIQSPGDNELSVVWDSEVETPDGPYQLRQKLRADGIRPEWDCVYDLKTTDNAARAAFERTIGNYRYDRQAGYYVPALNLNGFKISHFAFIAIEKEAPYGVAAYRLTNESIDIAIEELEKLKRTYAMCERHNRWPGHELEFKDISLPAWKFREIQKGLQAL